MAADVNFHIAKIYCKRQDAAKSNSIEHNLDYYAI